MVAELLGTALLVLFGAGSAVAAATVGAGSMDFAGLGFVGLSFGIAIAVAVYAFGTVSGAHINPAVTIALAVARRFSWADVVPYVVAQLVGATVGALLIVGMYGPRSVHVGLVGATTLADGVGIWSGLLAEVLATFLLVLTVMALAVDARAPAGWAGLMIGLAVACAIIVVAPLTGAALNPARAFGPYLVATLFGGTVPWREFPLYCVGPIIGGALAALVYLVVSEPAPAAAD
nr:MIP/aquaporin family protein [Pseudonocardia acidicola]